MSNPGLRRPGGRRSARSMWECVSDVSHPVIRNHTLQFAPNRSPLHSTWLVRRRYTRLRPYARHTRRRTRLRCDCRDLLADAHRRTTGPTDFATPHNTMFGTRVSCSTGSKWYISMCDGSRLLHSACKRNEACSCSRWYPLQNCLCKDTTRAGSATRGKTSAVVTVCRRSRLRYSGAVHSGCICTELCQQCVDLRLVVHHVHVREAFLATGGAQRGGKLLEGGLVELLVLLLAPLDAHLLRDVEVHKLDGQETELSVVRSSQLATDTPT